MNFKPNAWTLLFVLALGGFFFQMMNKPTPEDSINSADIAFLNSKKNCEKEKSDKLKYELGSTRHAKYIAYAEIVKLAIDEFVAKDTARKRIWDEVGVVNPGVFSFELPTCELYQMLKEMPAGTSNVYAYMVISPYERNEERMLDFVFYQEKIVESLDPPKLKGGGDESGSFYDFTKPCPPVCDPPPG